MMAADVMGDVDDFAVEVVGWCGGRRRERLVRLIMMNGSGLSAWWCPVGESLGVRFDFAPRKSRLLT